MEYILDIYRGLLSKVPMYFVRFLYNRINWEARLIGITGARGTGKTTLLLQRIRRAGIEKQSLFVSLDNMYFANRSLLDLAREFYQLGGHYLFVDEVHKYENWSREIKNIYDSFPDMHIVFTGSSILDLKKGFGDLSRRLLPYQLPGMSFREYLAFDAGLIYNPVSLDDLLQQRVDIKIDRPLKYFKQYLQTGYYPFYREKDFKTRLTGVIQAVLEVDIPKYTEMRVSTIERMKQLFQIIADGVPFKPNIVKLADIMLVSRSLLPDYFSFLEQAGLIIQLRDDTAGIRSLGKVKKVYLNNTNLMYALTAGSVNIGTMRETFFLNQLNEVASSSLPKQGDFKTGEITFEIGGKEKGDKQIQNLDQAYIVRDDIENGYGNVIPLWQVGFLY